MSISQLFDYSVDGQEFMLLNCLIELKYQCKLNQTK